MKITLNNQLRFPVGTTVKAYLRSNWQHQQIPPEGAPKGAAAAEAVVDASGNVALLGLAENTKYFAAAEVGGEWRYERFFTAAPAVPTAATFSPDAYGATGDGVTPDEKGVKAALAAATAVAEAGGTGIVDFNGQKSYLLNSGGGIALAVNLPGRVILRGNGATIKLTAGCPRFLDGPKVANHNTYRGYTVQDFEVDAGNVPGSHHVIFGSFINGGSAQYTNYESLVFRRIHAFNIYTADDASYRAGIFIKLQQNKEAAEEPIANFARNILCEDITIDGGWTGVAILGVTQSAETVCGNIQGDNLTARRVRHVVSEAPLNEVPRASAHIQFGSKMIGGSFLIEDCYGKNSGDVGIETNSFTNGTIANCLIEDSCTANYYQAAHGLPANPAGQITRYSSCDAARHQRTKGRGFASGTGLGKHPSPLEYTDCSYHSTTTPTVAATEGWVFDEGDKTPSIVMRGCRGVASGINYAAVGNLVPGMVVVKTGADVDLTITDMYTEYSGVKAGGSGAFQPNHLLINTGNKTRVQVDRWRMVTNIEGGSNTFNMIDVGGGGTNTIGGALRNLKMETGAATTPRGFYIRPTEQLTIDGALAIEGCDFTGMTGGGVEVNFDVGATALKKQVIMRRNRWRDGTFVRVAAGVVPTGSPFTYANEDGTTQRLNIKGGTVTLIEVTNDNVSYFALNGTGGYVVLEPGETVRITYTLPPTVTKLPMRA